jgi:drug/metabolite transporter (DMT)-like permease
MTLLALILVATSTITHALWNFLGKRSEPAPAFFEIAMLAASVCLSPILFYYFHLLPLIPLQIWGLLLLTAACQSLYYIGLAGAYRTGQLSVAYPLVRALPALLVTLISLTFSLGSPLGVWGYGGVILVVMGCLSIPMTSWKELDLKQYITPCCALAFLAACGTTGYTLIDNEALSRLRSTPGLNISAIEIAALFMLLETATSSLILGLYVGLVPSERRTFQKIWKTNLRYTAITGVIITLTYGLVLAAMAYVTNISYLAAFRELSIPIGAILGITLQKEPAPPPKIVGVFVVLAGLLLISLG